MTRNVVGFSDIGLADVPIVGGKNASLGELRRAVRSSEVRTLDGFATTADAFRTFLSQHGLREVLKDILDALVPGDVSSLQRCGAAARKAVLDVPLQPDLTRDVEAAYEDLCSRLGREPEFAVRSSATAEDLPQASFAGQHSTYLNIRGKPHVLGAIHNCFASLFTDRAIDYRLQNGFDHLAVALSVGVQPMVRSDLACSGVMFTLDTESGFRDVVQVTGSYGLGETIVQGDVNPDEWTLFKPTLEQGFEAIIRRRMGTKESKLVFGDSETRAATVDSRARSRYCLSDREVEVLGRAAVEVEKHYSSIAGQPEPMDIEWAKDGLTGDLVILQARPETVHATRRELETRVFHIPGKHEPAIVTGQAIGEAIASGPVRIVHDVSTLDDVRDGDVLVAVSTNPDWEPVMRRVAAIVTDQGGRTAHAAIVSREIGVPCVVAAGDATSVLRDGEVVTVSCAEGLEGHIYKGAVPFEVERVDLGAIPQTLTKVMINVGDPGRAFGYAALPHAGVGLARMEFIISGAIGVHPMALAHYPHLKNEEALHAVKQRLAGADPLDYFIMRLSEGIATIAAAMHPRPVIVRTSDFKTNEYADLLGGAEFESAEENPMLGFRGASRYCDERYADGFALECAAISRVRDHMGLVNVKVMIPFCRTVQEARKVIAEMGRHGLNQGDNGLEVYAMCEIPSNVLEADAFLEVFDGYSIGSNDLTQLTLGLDRDSAAVSGLFDERDPAVKKLIAEAIRAAHRAKKPIGICGQAPSDYPEFAAWLVGQDITSISLNPDSFIGMTKVIAQAEKLPAGPASTGKVPEARHK